MRLAVRSLKLTVRCTEHTRVCCHSLFLCAACRSNTFIWGDDAAHHPTLRSIPVHRSLAQAAAAAAAAATGSSGASSSPAAKRQRTG
jgi:hypothetical protein